jgi:hypothetical protein
VRLRPYAPGDQAALAKLWFESWLSVGLEDPTDPVVTLAELSERVPRELAGRWGVTVAESEERLIGFLALAPSEGRLDQLFIAVARRRLPDGFWLGAHAANLGARVFYERRGMVLDRYEPGDRGDRAIYVWPGRAAEGA